MNSSNVSCLVKTFCCLDFVLKIVKQMRSCFVLFIVECHLCLMYVVMFLIMVLLELLVQYALTVFVISRFCVSRSR